MIAPVKFGSWISSDVGYTLYLASPPSVANPSLTPEKEREREAKY